MKKMLLFFAACLICGVAVTQVQRNIVILEIGTGVTCQYCPGAAMGAYDLLAAGSQVGVIEYHNYYPASDPFSNTYAAARTGYYGIGSYPTSKFDGVLTHVGGSTNVSLYPEFLPLYTQRYAVPSPLTIDISGTNTGNVYNITLTITKMGTITATDLKAHLALTESNISYSWFGQSVINDAERLMAPDANGTSISFASGNTVTINLTFTKDPSWITSNCELIAFVQDNGSKEILNGSKVALNGLYLPLPVAFTGTPTSGCTPLTVQYTDQSTGATEWDWTFPGGNPATSTLQNPTVVYNNPGTFDVTLVASNLANNQMGFLSQPGYISVNTLPVTPGAPQGNNSLCVNPANETYTIAPVPNTTGYLWELMPATAGVITNNGASCTIDWDNAYTGIAQLKVRAANGCGNTSWSPYLNIAVNVTPGQAAEPTGPTTLCMNSGSSNYLTTGVANATTYNWELDPANAGIVYPNGTAISINWYSTFSGTATLKVKGVNGSCEGVWSTPLTINVTPGPAAYIISGGGVYCAVGGTGMPVNLSGSQINTNYTLYLDGTATTTIIPGTGSAIAFSNQMNAGTYSVVAASGNCSNPMTGSAIITIDPQAPLAPGAPEGPAQVYTGATPTAEYNTTGGQYASTYTWELEPASAGTISGSSTTATVNWDLTYIGEATIKVQGVNSCGGGSYSTEYNVTVDVGVSVEEHNNPKLVSIFPNPAKTMVTIMPVHAINANITISDALGVTVLTRDNVALSGNHQIDLSTLKAGIYFIRIMSKEGQQIIKLMIR